MRLKLVVISIFLAFNSSLFAQCIEGDCMNGFGVFTCDCGYTFKGDFKDGQKVNGTLTKEDLVYTGTFKNDMADGYGLIRYTDGSWYEGEFSVNQPHGYGKFQFASGVTYIGQFNNGDFNGLGVILEMVEDSVLREYQIGYFENDELQGIGFSMYLNGNMYFGTHNNGEKTGYGIFIISASQDAEIGVFKPSKNTKNIALVNYPESEKFLGKAFTYKGVTYTSKGNIKGENLIISSATKSDSVFYFFDSKKQLFFASQNNSDSGVAINTKGEIYKAQVQVGKETVILMDTILYKWTAEHH